MAQDAHEPITNWGAKRSGTGMALKGDREGGLVSLQVVKIELRPGGPVAIDKDGKVYLLAGRR